MSQSLNRTILLPEISASRSIIISRAAPPNRATGYLRERKNMQNSKMPRKIADNSMLIS
jgi:hypothetical protein